MKVSTSDARTKLPELIAKAEAGEPVELTRYGSTQAVILSNEKYQRLMRNLMGSE
ncbi:type II toxin-antitoxin system prevent-host-death family antitoxin [Streptomyces sp. NPDC048556]|uniref:type II toxin-antitoxin system Phd/YefM family antitoxin n=1 Tax=Streptomyces sp. NPDC048556 TaxID=3156664 RepID=UPI00341E0D12